MSVILAAGVFTAFCPLGAVVVVSSCHQSPRCGVSRFRSAKSITIPLSVWSASISRHTEAESRSSIAGIGRSATKNAI